MIGLILDHNGVVCAADNFYEQRSRRVAKILGVPWNADFLTYWKQLYLEASAGKISLETYYQKLAEASEVKLTGSEDERFVAEEKIIPEIKPVLATLALNPAIRICLLSNYVEKWVRMFVINADLRKYFHTILVSSAIKVRKPEPAAFEIAAKKMKLPLNRCMYIGDSVVDLAVCKKLGIKPIFIPGEDQSAPGYKTIEGVEEIPALFS